MNFGKKRKKAFTLAETVIVVTMFSSVIVLILTAVNKYVTYLSQARLQTIALNLTRGGMETLYQWRDTNREHSEGEKDKKIFCLDPFNCDSYITSGYYGFALKNSSRYHVDYLALMKIQDHTSKLSDDDLEKLYSDFSAFLQDNDANFEKIKDLKMYFRGEFKGDANFTGTINEIMGREAEFYRIVKINGIYRKDNGASINAANIVDINNKTIPVELDACVKTFFISFDGIVGESELCGLLTNFNE